MQRLLEGNHQDPLLPSDLEHHMVTDLELPGGEHDLGHGHTDRLPMPIERADEEHGTTVHQAPAGHKRDSPPLHMNRIHAGSIPIALACSCNSAASSAGWKWNAARS